eukprot:g65712.t1
MVISVILLFLFASELVASQGLLSNRSQTLNTTSATPPVPRSPTRTWSTTTEAPWPACGAGGCQACQGDCNQDSDCQGAARCFQRRANETVPGCPAVTGEAGKDFCYSLSNNPITFEQTSCGFGVAHPRKTIMNFLRTPGSKNGHHPTVHTLLEPWLSKLSDGSPHPNIDDLIAQGTYNFPANHPDIDSICQVQLPPVSLPGDHKDLDEILWAGKRTPARGHPSIQQKLGWAMTSDHPNVDAIMSADYTMPANHPSVSVWWFKQPAASTKQAASDSKRNASDSEQPGSDSEQPSVLQRLLTGQTFCDGPVCVEWEVLFEEKLIRITMTGAASGWISVGFSTKPSMTDLDCYTGFLDSAGRPTLLDSYSVNSFDVPLTDREMHGQDNALLIEGSSEDGKLTFVFTRPLDTQDRTGRDQIIGDFPLYIIWAVSDGDVRTIHSLYGISSPTNLLTGKQVTTTASAGAWLAIFFAALVTLAAMLRWGYKLVKSVKLALHRRALSKQKLTGGPGKRISPAPLGTDDDGAAKSSDVDRSKDLENGSEDNLEEEGMKSGNEPTEPNTPVEQQAAQMLPAASLSTPPPRRGAPEQLFESPAAHDFERKQPRVEEDLVAKEPDSAENARLIPVLRPDELEHSRSRASYVVWEIQRADFRGSYAQERSGAYAQETSEQPPSLLGLLPTAAMLTATSTSSALPTAAMLTATSTPSALPTAAMLTATSTSSALPTAAMLTATSTSSALPTAAMLTATSTSSALPTAAMPTATSTSSALPTAAMLTATSTSSALPTAAMLTATSTSLALPTAAMLTATSTSSAPDLNLNHRQQVGDWVRAAGESESSQPDYWRNQKTGETAWELPPQADATSSTYSTLARWISPRKVVKNKSEHEVVLPLPPKITPRRDRSAPVAAGLGLSASAQRALQRHQQHRDLLPLYDVDKKYQAMQPLPLVSSVIGGRTVDLNHGIVQDLGDVLFKEDIDNSMGKSKDEVVQLSAKQGSTAHTLKSLLTGTRVKVFCCCTQWSLSNLLVLLCYVLLHAAALAATTMSGMAVDWGKGFGSLAAANLMFLLMYATRNSILTLMLGLPFELLLLYHRALGRIALVCAIAHFAIYFDRFLAAPASRINLFGFMSLLSGVAIFLTSFNAVRRHCFQLFYWSHLAGFILFYGFAWAHVPQCKPFFTVGLSVYLLDKFLSSVWMRLPRRTVTFAYRGANVAHVKFRRDRLTHALGMHGLGQYYFVNFPAVSLSEWHPFSCSSSPRDHYVHLNIRGLGDYTQKVVDLAKRTTALAARSRQSGEPLNLPLICIDGPYGNLGFNLRRYPVLLLVGGGVGVTPILGILKDLYNVGNIADKDKALPHCIEEVFVVWAFRNNNDYYVFKKNLARCLAQAKNKPQFPKLRVMVYATREKQATSPILVGRPDFKALFATLDSFHIAQKKACLVFACGPEYMVNELWDLSSLLARSKALIKSFLISRSTGAVCVEQRCQVSILVLSIITLAPRRNQKEQISGGYEKFEATFDRDRKCERRTLFCFALIV